MNTSETVLTSLPGTLSYSTGFSNSPPNINLELEIVYDQGRREGMSYHFNLEALLLQCKMAMADVEPFSNNQQMRRGFKKRGSWNGGNEVVDRPELSLGQRMLI